MPVTGIPPPRFAGIRHDEFVFAGHLYSIPVRDLTEVSSPLTLQMAFELTAVSDKRYLYKYKSEALIYIYIIKKVTPLYPTPNQNFLYDVYYYKSVNSLIFYLYKI